jgi:glucose-6-phosphate 1-epimerase
MFTTLRSTDGAQATIAHNGGHVISWIPVYMPEQLFLSKTSSLKPGHAIRGGVPVIFPQFAGMGTLPKHGFARTQLWQYRDDGNTDRAIFELRDNPSTQAIWPHAFFAELVVSLSGNSLAMDLSIQNTGPTEFQFTTALHTYLRVENIADVCIQGLKNCDYQDFVSGQNNCVESSNSISIQGHVDRLYKNVPSSIDVLQRHQRVTVRQDGFTDAVVWNPWRDLGASLSDLEQNGYERMICVESATVSTPVQLAPNAIWKARQHLSCHPS